MGFPANQNRAYRLAATSLGCRSIAWIEVPADARRSGWFEAVFRAQGGHGLLQLFTNPAETTRLRRVDRGTDRRDQVAVWGQQWRRHGERVRECDPPVEGQCARADVGKFSEELLHLACLFWTGQVEQAVHLLVGNVG